MRNLSRSCVLHGGSVLCRITILSFFLPTIALTVMPLFGGQGNTHKNLKEKTTLEVLEVQVPFIANKGQVDERVLFYAPTFGGTIFVKEDGEIVYSLPEGRRGSEGTKERDGKQTQNHLMQDARGIALREQLVGGTFDEIKGVSKSVTTVNFFTGNDPSKHKIGWLML